MTKLIISIILLTLASNAQAQVKAYFELGIEHGGNPVVVSDPGGIYAGGGSKFVFGIQNEIGNNGERLSIALGYLSDEGGESDEGEETTAYWYDDPQRQYEFSTVTLDAIYTRGNDLHRFGIGGTIHIGPTYNDNLLRTSLNFDDAPGLVFQYTRRLWRRYSLGTRFTIMNYKVGDLSVDADSFGIFLSNGY
jgi:hypothetical protein